LSRTYVSGRADFSDVWCRTRDATPDDSAADQPHDRLSPQGPHPHSTSLCAARPPTWSLRYIMATALHDMCVQCASCHILSCLPVAPSRICLFALRLRQLLNTSRLRLRQAFTVSSHERPPVWKDPGQIDHPRCWSRTQRRAMGRYRVLIQSI
jgi:hypothetical protein